MKSIFVTFLLVITFALAGAASASSLFLDGAGSATLGLGDNIDQVILTDASHVDIDVGAIIGEVTLLDDSTADIFGGVIGGDLEVFENGVVNLHGTLDSFTIDGNPAPAVITAADCPSCSLVGELDSLELLAVTAEVLQDGAINVPVTVVPEPSSIATMGLGLFGLALCGHRLRLV